MTVDGTFGPLVAVELIGITKTFPGVRANDRVDLVLRAGEVQCLLGENGAGKTTLMNILAGVLRPDEGVIRVDRRPVAINSPRDARALGVGMVHQHSDLVPTFTVLENLMLGRAAGVRLPVQQTRRGLLELTARLAVEVDPDAVVSRLSLGQQQQVEIVRALWHGCRVLILDEPTSMLTPQGVAHLEGVLRQLAEQGLAIVFITHKLPEALAVGDCISVLRQGRLSGTLTAEVLAATRRDELEAAIVEMMFPGESRTWERAGDTRADARGVDRRRAVLAEPLLELLAVQVHGGRGEVGIEAGFDLEVHAGEVVGVAGVDGNGQRPLAEAIAGQRPLAAGDIRFAGLSIRRLSVGARQRLGLGYVTDDRLGEGIVPSLGVATNLVSKRIGLPPFWRHGRVRRQAIDEHARQLAREFGIAAPDVHARADTLSGGTVQKLLLARELSFDPKVVVFSKPTHGLDVKTAAAVRARIHELVGSGRAGALVISADLEELLELCDRVAVLSRGRLVGVVVCDAGAGQRIGELMAGGHSDE